MELCDYRGHKSMKVALGSEVKELTFEPEFPSGLKDSHLHYQRLQWAGVCLVC